MARLKIEVPKNSQQSRVGFMRNIRQKTKRENNKQKTEFEIQKEW